MNLKEYQTIIEKTAVYPKEVGLMYCALGLNGEAGEVAEVVKKLLRDTDYLKTKYISPENREKLIKENSDVLWYITAMCSEIGITLEELMQVNYDKLMKRRETNTIHGSGDNREDSPAE